MPDYRLSRRSIVLGATVLGFPAAADAQYPYYPLGGFTRSGAALDAPYVPTPPAVADAMLTLAKVTKDDFLIDLGCGDGRILIAAAKTYGARGFGVDLDPDRIDDAQKLSKAAGVSELVHFEVKDIFKTPLQQASVLALYLFPHLNERLLPKILKEMKPGSRVVSHGFPIGKWQPDRNDIVEGRRIHFWIVPAPVAGRWELTEAGDGPVVFDFEQRQQRIMADIREPAGVRIRNARLTGAQISFSLERAGQGRNELSGLVSGESMRGTDTQGRAWTARRIWMERTGAP